MTHLETKDVFPTLAVSLEMTALSGLTVKALTVTGTTTSAQMKLLRVNLNPHMIVPCLLATTAFPRIILFKV